MFLISKIKNDNDLEKTGRFHTTIKNKLLTYKISLLRINCICLKTLNPESYDKIIETFFYHIVVPGRGIGFIRTGINNIFHEREDNR